MVAMHYVDFDGLRTTGSLGDLPLSGLEMCAVRVELPPAAELLASSEPGAYTELVLRRLPRERLVLAGFCAGANIAYELAERLGTGIAGLILIDPVANDEMAMEVEYHALLRRLRAPVQSVTSLRTIAANLDRAYREYARIWSDAESSDMEDFREETVARYIEWLAFVQAARKDHATELSVPVHLVCSRDWRRENAPAWIGQGWPVVELPVEQRDLFESTEAAAALSRTATSFVRNWNE